MYLKRLDLQGFKSFPEKVKLEFNTGITAVVGPNGSGKSNVSDAVRWVLGEQRAKSLRGDKMEDIIFAGTENRKPQGFAEVTIVIDNEDGRMPVDFTEVQVTRRVFRSGESEYRINGTACRLKDIQELFMDTGVGKEGYSIIGQGKIDEILNAKGDERRRIFEEATGIVKYKTRKIEAVSKMEKEKQNLLRVEDIIQELETQLTPLEEQSQKAKQYLTLRENLKQAEIAIFCNDMARMEQENAQLLQNKQTAKQQSIDTNHVSEQIKEQIADKKQQRQQQTQLLEQLHQKMTQVQKDTEKTEGLIRLAEEQAQNDAGNITRIQKEIEEQQKQQQEKQKEQEVCRSRKMALQIALENIQKTLATKTTDYDTLNETLRQDETKAAQFKDDIFEQMRMGTEAKGEIAKREAMREQFLKRKNQLDLEIAHTHSRLEQQQVHQQVLQKKAESYAQTLTATKQELQALEKDHIQATNMKTQAEQALVTQQKHISEKQSRYRLLSELEKDHEGYYHSIKSLLALPDLEQRGICGAVGQLLQVEQMYETAIEAALGGAMQNVVTNTEDDAKNAIQYLKQRKLGRATFLPVRAVKGKGLESNLPILREIGVLGTADTLVCFDDAYQGIMTYLLGRILIVENLDIAVSLAKKYHHQYKMVTLDGDIMNAGGAMTGGSQSKKTSSIFGRTREIQTLQKELEQSDQYMKQLQQTLELAKEDLQDVAEQILEKKLELQRMSVTAQTSSTEIEKTETDIAETQTKLRLLELEEKQLDEQMTRTDADIAKSKVVVEQAEAETAKANEALLLFQDSLAEEKDKRDALLEEITQLKIQVSQQEQNILTVDDTINRLQKEQHALLREKEIKQEQIVYFKERGGKKSVEQQNLKKQAETLQTEQIQTQQKLEQSNQNLTAFDDSIANLEQQLQQHTETIAKLEQDLFRIETKLEKSEEEKDRMCGQIWEVYEITAKEALAYPITEQKSYQEWKRLANDRKETLRGLGHVNVDAIEQYKDLKERYTFLTNQKADILEAEQKLQQVIAELTTLMETQFKEQFAVISENFSTVFQEMFGGGKAYLQLSDDANVLESAIDIVAQPPGKSLQNMMLLSGGERALTAIAILFSILKMKPSPFCILDEIEAALDDANVRRYAQYLTRFSKETQFIVITHRKGTMEYADVMYGVTMQEKGVSKLISVDFSEQVEE